MKNFRRQNYYDLLEVGRAASLEDLTRAYHFALEAFSPDSLAAYSLFEPEEREDLLSAIKEAFRVLSNGRTRRSYDRFLAAKEAAAAAGGPGPPPFLDRPEEPAAPLGDLARPEPAPLTTIVKSQGEPLDLTEGEPLTGAVLVRLRASRGVELAELAQRTRISEEVLSAMEADLHDRLPAQVYLRGFLKAYAQALHLDPEKVCQGYFSSMAKAAPPSETAA